MGLLKSNHVSGKIEKPCIYFLGNHTIVLMRMPLLKWFGNPLFELPLTQDYEVLDEN